MLTLRCEEHQQEDARQFPGESHRYIGLLERLLRANSCDGGHGAASDSFGAVSRREKRCFALPERGEVGGAVRSRRHE